jgi:hypothetical protein
MPQGVKNERPHLAVFDCFPMLLLQCRWFDVTAFGFCWPNPTFFRFMGCVPSLLYDGSHARSHWQESPSRVRFAVRDKDRSMTTIYPSDIFPPLTETFLRTHTTIN